MNQKENPYNLIAKKLSGESTEEDNLLLENWLNGSIENKKEYEQMKKIDELITPEEYKPDVESALRNVHSKLPPQQKYVQKRALFYLKYSAAILVFGVFIATIVIPRIQTEKYLHISNNNANSLPMELALPDGSIVWLSYGSSIKHPVKFKGQERKVEFEGEAYFDITRNEKMPFIIETNETVTRVLGTEFVLRAYPSDNLVSVIVTQGKVSLSRLDSKADSSLVLTVGQKGVYHKESKKVQRVYADTQNASSLKTGQLKFYNTPMADIVKEIEYYYHKRIFIEGEGLDTIKSAQHFDNLEFKQVLEILKLSLDVVIEEENGIYKIKEKS